MLWCYLLTSWSRVLLEKLTSFQIVKKFPVFYGTRRFITASASARHLSLSWASSIQSITPHPTSWRSILLLSSHLHLAWTLSFRFPHQNPEYASPLLHTCYMSHLSHSSRFYHPNNIEWGVQIINPLNAELNPICHLLALLGTHSIFHVSRVRVKLLIMHFSPLPCFLVPPVVVVVIVVFLPLQPIVVVFSQPGSGL